MPSPFPGMDPYLEGSFWMTVHSQLIPEIARQLAPKLQPKYLALTTERFILDSGEDVAITSRSMYPDVGVAKTGLPASGGRGVGVITAPIEVPTFIPSRVPHVSVEIRDTANRQLVTAIEVLSPTNKRGLGRKEYLAKRRRLLVSDAHLMEIDLLRKGTRVPMLEPLPPAPYYALVSRVPKRPITDVWPVALDQPLPAVPVPLLPGDADAMLDLQLALTTIYDLLRYDLAIDYHRPPEVPLPPNEAAWADERLRVAGLRS